MINLNIKIMKMIQVIIIIINIIIHVYEFKNEKKNYTMAGKKREMLLCTPVFTWVNIYNVKLFN